MYNIQTRVAQLEKTYAVTDKPLRFVWLSTEEDEAEVRAKAEREHPGSKIILVSWLPTPARCTVDR